MKRFAVLLAVILGIVAVGYGPVYAAPPEQQNRCLISSPTSGSRVRGQVMVTGSAMHQDFTWYQIGYAPDPNPSGKWTFFASGETSVTSGRLGVWDTTTIPDGVYQLILEVHRKDGNNDHCFVTQIRINNSAPTPTYTAEPLPTSASTPTPLPTEVVKDTPTVAIDQPPTATPRPTPTYSAVDNPTPTPEMTRLKLPIDLATVRSAGCRGAQLAVAVTVVVGLYFVLRNLVASGVRKVWKPRDVEGFHSRRPRQY